MAYGTVNADVIQSSVSGVSLGAGNATSFKNRIINGAMVIDQRNAGALVSPANGYTLDRWYAQQSTDGTFSVQQSSTVPAGFKNSLLVTVTSADASIGATQYARLFQCIEGLNVSDLNWGSASAATVTLSFWVRASVTGTYGGSVGNSAADRTYPFTYTINAANTFEQKSITIAGDQSGTWLTTNGIGIFLQLAFAAGSTLSGTSGAWAGANYLSATGATNLMATNGATFYITGVQLEVGSSATGFDYRPYGTELSLCQRYYETINMVGNSYYNGSNGCPTLIPQNTRKRAQPTVTRTNDNWDGWNVNMGNYNETSDAAGGISVWCNVTGGTTGFVRWSTTLLISAEL
jgi:hypothetical protein